MVHQQELGLMGIMLLVKQELQLQLEEELVVLEEVLETMVILAVLLVGVVGVVVEMELVVLEQKEKLF